MDKIICKQCNKEFLNYKSNNRVFCSNGCKNLFAKTRVGKKNKKYKRVEKICLECGNKFIVKNYRKDIAKFCSHKCEDKSRDIGRTNKNKRIRGLGEYKLWRELVYERDDYTCQKCLERGIELNPHHIFNFSNKEELRFDVDNGITLCRKCHYEFHKMYGFNNNNSEQIYNFLGCVAVAQEA